MTDLRDAARQALEALENTGDLWWNSKDEAITALRAALEQPERAQAMRDAGYTRRPTLREMAALAGSEWREHAPEYEKGFIDGMSEQARRSVDRFVNAMAAPIIQPRREWQVLTEEDIWTLAANSMDSVLGRLHFARAIEAALKEKNHE
jgi:hypothetical protein